MTDKSIKSVLLVEDNPGDARLLREMFSQQGAQGIALTHVESMRDAERHLSRFPVDLVLLDLDLADARGLEAIRRARAAGPCIPLVVLTGLDDESIAAQALRDGAQDYQIKGQIEPRGLLRAINNSIERKNLERRKEELISIVSHELRTPLTSITGSLGLLAGQWGSKLPESAARLVSLAHANCRRLIGLVDDILDLDKIASGNAEFSVRRVDLFPLLQQVIDGNRGFADKYGVRIQFDVASINADISTDPDRLAQVVTNLLSNAIKFSPPGSEVKVKAERIGTAARISIRDHGGGIPAAFKPHIFKRFAQASAVTSGRKEGSGLGLSIVKEIVERLGGSVGFQDAPGGGTVFYVDLPARAVSTDVEIAIGDGRKTDAPRDPTSPPPQHRYSEAG